MIKTRWILMTLTIPGGVIFWNLMLPTQVVDVHYKSESDSYFVIVKNFPFTDSGKIKWWEENRHLLGEKYNIPVNSDKYSISFWTGDYKEEPNTDQGSDLLCFYDMKSKKKCIEKDSQPLKIWYSKDDNETQTTFLFNNWQRTRIKKDSIK